MTFVCSGDRDCSISRPEFLSSISKLWSSQAKKKKICAKIPSRSLEVLLPELQREELSLVSAPLGHHGGTWRSALKMIAAATSLNNMALSLFQRYETGKAEQALRYALLVVRNSSMDDSSNLNDALVSEVSAQLAVAYSSDLHPLKVLTYDEVLKSSLESLQEVCLVRIDPESNEHSFELCMSIILYNLGTLCLASQKVQKTAALKLFKLAAVLLQHENLDEVRFLVISALRRHDESTDNLEMQFMHVVHQLHYKQALWPKESLVAPAA